MSAVKQEDLHPTEKSASRTAVHWMMGIFVTGAGLTFVYKFYQFFQDFADGAGIHFAGPHLVTYTLVAAGFLCLLLYAFLKGHFSNIEQPKYDLLEKEIAYDRALPVADHRG